MAMKKLRALLGSGMAIVALLPVQACVHVPRTYKGTVTEKTKEALLFHDGANAHLIIKTNLKASSGSLPETMAWVIPLPSLPSHYEEADPGLFPEMFQTVEKANQDREREAAAHEATKAAVAPAPEGIRVHPMQIVGSYQVQPVEVLDLKNAGGELNRWLVSNGFSAVPLEAQRPYLKKGVVFLTLRLNGLRGGFSDIKPLHIVYKSDTLSLPLKFSTNSGVFDVELYTFTPGPLDGAVLGGDHLYADPSVKIQRSEDAPRLGRVVGGRSGYLTRFEGWNFNAPQRYVRDLSSDPTIDPRKDNAPRLPSVADTEEARRDGVADLRALGAVLVVVVGFEFWRRRRVVRPPAV